MPSEWRPEYPDEFPRKQVTMLVPTETRVDVTPAMLAEVFCQLGDEDQAQFIIEVARLARGHDGDEAIVGTRTGEALARLIGLPCSHAMLDHFDLMNVYPFEGQHVERWTNAERAEQAVVTMRYIECRARAWVVCLGGGV